MIIADMVALGGALLFAIIGLIFGFGKGLKFITGGIFGFILSIAICYVISGFVLEISFVNEFAMGINEALSADGNVFFDFLVKINAGFIVVYIIMFVAVQLVRIIIISILKSIFEINNGFMKFINKTFGIILYLAIGAALALVAFQIIAWIGGDSAESFRALLEGSVLKLDWIYDNNPLKAIMELAQI